MPKKPPVVQKDPRTLSAGITIWHPDLQRTEVVRDVVVVLQLANGESRSYKVGQDQVDILKDQPDLLKEAEILVEKETLEQATMRLRAERAVPQPAPDTKENG
jgi:hypothetical protein